MKLKKIILSLILFILLVITLNVDNSYAEKVGFYTEDGDYITRVLPETTVSNFISCMGKTDNVYVKDEEGNVLDYEDIVKTGMTVTFDNLEYKISVVGDLNGDGLITITDYIQAKLHFNKVTELGDDYVRSADIDGNGNITLTDLVRLNLITMNLRDVSDYVEYEEFTVNEEDDIFYTGLDEEVLDPSGDEDNDGLTNAEEENLGTNVYSKDSDNDGLNDFYEVNTSHTDPLKADTDDDGLSDGDEYLLELDPLKADSKDDGIIDGQRQLTYTIEDQQNGVSIEISGKGNIATTLVNRVESEELQENNEMLNYIYIFETNGELESATVIISYSQEEIDAKGIDEDDLSLYYINSDTNELEKVDSIVDKDANTITATLYHFSGYAVSSSSSSTVSSSKVIANSGFDISKNAFQFDNYGTNLSDGNCYGIAYFTMNYFKDQLSMTGESNEYSVDYDLRDTIFDGFNTTSGRDNKNLADTLEYKEIKIMRYIDSRDNSDVIVDNEKSLERLIENAAKAKSVTSYDKEKLKQLIRAIATVHFIQRDDDEYTFLECDTGNDYLKTLQNYIKSGSPQLISIRFNNGDGHAVNATKIIDVSGGSEKFKVDGTNYKMYYKIMIYDSNNPYNEEAIYVGKKKIYNVYKAEYDYEYVFKLETSRYDNLGGIKCIKLDVPLDNTKKADIYLNSINVTYDANGGTVSPLKSDRMNNHYIRLPEATKTGYTFKGWYEDKNCTESKKVTIAKAYNSIEKVYKYRNDKNVTLYAGWTKEKAYVTLNANGGSFSYSIDPTKYVYNRKIGNTINISYMTPSYNKKITIRYYDENQNLIKSVETELKFLGWYKDQVEYKNVTVTEEDQTLYAHWGINLNNLLKDSNYDGWYLDKDFAHKATNDYLIENNEISLYGKKKSVASTDCYVTFDANGGTISNRSTLEMKLKYNQKITVDNLTYSIIGKAYKETLDENGNTIKERTSINLVFDGWFTEREGGKKVEYVPSSSSVTLYAHWYKQGTYFMSNIGEYKFEGLYEDKQFTKPYGYDVTYTFSDGGKRIRITYTKATTIYAKYVKNNIQQETNYTIKFNTDYNALTNPTNIVGKKGSQANLPYNIGYKYRVKYYLNYSNSFMVAGSTEVTLKGWKSSLDNKIYTNGDTYTISGNDTLTPIWQTTLLTLNNVKSGYTFDGTWYDSLRSNANAVGKSGNLYEVTTLRYLYGTPTKSNTNVEYTITYDLNGGTVTYNGQTLTSFTDKKHLNDKIEVNNSNLQINSKQYKVRYYVNGKAIDLSDTIQEYYLGWYISQTGGNKLSTVTQEVANKGKVYAHWGNAKQLITVNGSQTLSVPKLAKLIDKYGNETSITWYKDSALANKIGVGGDTYTPEEGMILYGQYNENEVKEYTVEYYFMNDAGEYQKSYSLTTTKPNDYKALYEGLGFYLEDTIKDEQNKIVKYKYSKKYTIIYEANGLAFNKNGVKVSQVSEQKLLNDNISPESELLVTTNATIDGTSTEIRGILDGWYTDSVEGDVVLKVTSKIKKVWAHWKWNIQNPTQNGKKFVGWVDRYDQPIYDLSDYINTKLANNEQIIFNSKFESEVNTNTYKVIHKKQGFSGNYDITEKTIEYTVNDIGKTVNVPFLPDSELVGFKKPALKSLKLNSITDSYEVEYIYTRQSYNVTFNLNGGTVDNESSDIIMTADYGERIAYPQSYGVPKKYVYVDYAGEGGSYYVNGNFIDTNVNSSLILPDEDRAKSNLTFKGWEYNGEIVTSITMPASNVTLKATWGDATPVTLPSPTKQGYRFVGWYKYDYKVESNYNRSLGKYTKYVSIVKRKTDTEDLAGTAFSQFKPDNNIVLFALWEGENSIPYKVVHKVKDSDYIFDSEIKYGTAGQKVATNEANEYTGYVKPNTATVYYIDSSGKKINTSVINPLGTVVNLNQKEVSSGTTIVEYNYTKKKYMVVFNANGGKILKNNYSYPSLQNSVYYGDSLDLPTNVTNNFTVTLVGLGGTFVTEMPRYKETTGIISFAVNTEFEGWYTEKEGGTKVTDSYRMEDKNITLYAHWKTAKTYIPASGGNIDIEGIYSDTGLYNYTFKGKDGYNFEGWYTASSYKTTNYRSIFNYRTTETANWFSGNVSRTSYYEQKYDNLITLGNTRVDIEKNTVLFAKWEPRKDTSYKVVYTYKKGNEVEKTEESAQMGTTNVTVAYSGSNAFVSASEVEGYTLSKTPRIYYKDSNGREINCSTIRGDNSTVIEYTYTRKKYRLTLNANNGRMTVDGKSLATYYVDVYSGDEVELYTPEYNYTLNLVGMGGKFETEDDTYKSDINNIAVLSSAEFLGWNTKKDGTGEFKSFTTMPGENVVLYAQWGEAKFDLPGINSTVSAKGSDNFQHQYTFKEKIGYTFEGWRYVKARASGAIVGKFYKRTNATSSWGPQNSAYGFVFNMDSYVDEEIYSGRFTATENTTMFAQWEPKTNIQYTVRHVKKIDNKLQEDGAISYVQTGKADKRIVAAREIGKITDADAEPMEFTGYEVYSISIYYLDSNGKKVIDSKIRGDGSTIVEYVYTKKKYKVIFNADGGYGGATNYYYYGDTIEAPKTDPYKYYSVTFYANGGSFAGTWNSGSTEYYESKPFVRVSAKADFIRWKWDSGESAKIGGKMPAGDVTFKATYGSATVTLPIPGGFDKFENNFRFFGNGTKSFDGWYSVADGYTMKSTTWSRRSTYSYGWRRSKTNYYTQSGSVFNKFEYDRYYGYSGTTSVDKSISLIAKWR